MYSWPHRYHSSPPPLPPPEGKIRKPEITKIIEEIQDWTKLTWHCTEVRKKPLQFHLQTFKISTQNFSLWNTAKTKAWATKTCLFVSNQVGTRLVKSGKRAKTYLRVSSLFRSNPSALCYSPLSSRNLDSHCHDHDWVILHIILRSVNWIYALIWS